MKALARHFLAEYYGCDRDLLDDQVALEQALTEAAAAAKTTLISTHLHRFSPQGVSGVAILAESHLAIHTWPEHGFAAVELFVCGSDGDPAAGDAVLRAALCPTHAETRLLERGDPARLEQPTA